MLDDKGYYEMDELLKICIKDCTKYLFDGTINIKNFDDPNNIKVDERPLKLRILKVCVKLLYIISNNING